jgi:hypothetical protein
MSICRQTALLIALLSTITSVRCQTEDSVAQEVPCPGAMAWNQTHRDQSPRAIAERDKARTFTAPELRQELQQRSDKDQHARKQLLATPHDQSVVRTVAAIDAENLNWLKDHIRESGIPSVQQVGEEGIIWIWLLVQHADKDPKLQASVLPSFAKLYEAGDLPPDYLAKLTDRVLLRVGKPQRFGTQFDWLSGEFKPRKVSDTTDIETHRKELGLMPLADYACMMNARLKNKTTVEESP